MSLTNEVIAYHVSQCQDTIHQVMFLEVLYFKSLILRLFKFFCIHLLLISVSEFSERLIISEKFWKMNEVLCFSALIMKL